MLQRTLTCLACLTSCFLAGSGVERAWPQQPAQTASSSEKEDVLSSVGFTVTKGAAPGYLDDKACERCHQDTYRSYQETGMARSFSRADANNAP